MGTFLAGGAARANGAAAEAARKVRREMEVWDDIVETIAWRRGRVGGDDGDVELEGAITRGNCLNPGGLQTEFWRM